MFMYDLTSTYANVTNHATNALYGAPCTDEARNPRVYDRIIVRKESSSVDGAGQAGLVLVWVAAEGTLGRNTLASSGMPAKHERSRYDGFAFYSLSTGRFTRACHSARVKTISFSCRDWHAVLVGHANWYRLQELQASRTSPIVYLHSRVLDITQMIFSS